MFSSIFFFFFGNCYTLMKSCFIIKTHLPIYAGLQWKLSFCELLGFKSLPFFPKDLKIISFFLLVHLIFLQHSMLIMWIYWGLGVCPFLQKQKVDFFSINFCSVCARQFLDWFGCSDLVLIIVPYKEIGRGVVVVAKK